MEFNEENFNTLLKENSYLKRRIDRNEIDRKLNEWPHSCPWAVIENKEISSKSPECGVISCRECKLKFWDEVHEYLNNKYK